MVGQKVREVDAAALAAAQVAQDPHARPLDASGSVAAGSCQHHGKFFGRVPFRQNILFDAVN